MEKIKSYSVGILMSFLGVFPPLYLAVKPPSHYWPWFVTSAALAGFYTIFIRTDPIVKVIAVGAFIHAFFSVNPFESFTQYINIVFCCYFYIICRSIKDHTIIMNFLKSLVILNLLMFTMQYFHHDRLLNFSSQVCFGVVGQTMQSSSFSVILAAALMVEFPLVILFPAFTAYFCNSIWTIFAILAGIVPLIYDVQERKFAWRIFGALAVVALAIAFLSGKVNENIQLESGRLGAWVAAFKMWLVHPFIGWGFGTFKGIFPALQNTFGMSTSIPWKTLHNCWGQILIEGGLVWFSIILGYYVYLVKGMIDLLRRKILRTKARFCLAGLLMMGMDMMVHFPTRMIQTVLIIVFFLSYCNKVISDSCGEKYE